MTKLLTKNAEHSKVSFPPRMRRRGLVLVMVFWAIMLMAVIVAVAARAGRFDTRISVHGGERVRGRWACRAGIEKAIALLNDDPRAADCLEDFWNDTDGQLTDLVLEDAVCQARVVDEAGKLNVNQATKEQLLTLPDMTETIADAIIDWRDQDGKPAAQGAEQGYYQNLKVGYKIRNGSFRTVRELLMVKGVSRELLYGEDTNLNGRLDHNERDQDASPPGDNGDDVLDYGWLAYLTCYSYDTNKDASQQSRINISIADEKKLTESLKIKKSHAKWIVENRKNKNDNKGNNRDNKSNGGGNKKPPQNDSDQGGFKSIADLIDKDSPGKATKKDSDKAEKIDMETFKKIADQITVTDDKQILGRVNVNTASRTVLTALLGDQLLADNVIAHRQGLPTGMSSIAELLDVKSIKTETFKKIASSVTTRSNVFWVTCRATSDRTGALHQAEAVVDRGTTPTEILYLYQGSNN